MEIETIVLMLALLLFTVILIWYFTYNHIITYWTNKKLNNFWSITGKQNNFILHDLRKICLVYIGITMKSNILKEFEIANLHSLLLPHFNFNNRYYKHFKLLNISLLYSASCCGSNKEFNKTLYYESCCGYKNVLILFVNNFENVIGGFLSIGIRKIPKFGFQHISKLTRFFKDANAFLFRIRSCNNLRSKIFKLKDSNKALALSNCSVLSFGEFDLCLLGKGKEGLGECYSFGGDVYDFEPVSLLGGDCGNERVINVVQSIEVFQIHL